jgi:hypothetical protein
MVGRSLLLSALPTLLLFGYNAFDLCCVFLEGERLLLFLVASSDLFFGSVGFCSVSVFFLFLLNLLSHIKLLC